MNEKRGGHGAVQVLSGRLPGGVEENINMLQWEL
jgi:hypothetical protein